VRTRHAGLLQRAHIVANWPPIYIGKESDRHWEEGEDTSLLDFKAIEYKPKGYVLAADEQLTRIANRMSATRFSLVPRYSRLYCVLGVVHRSVPMPQRYHALILLAGSALLACAIAAQEEQHPPADSREFRIYRIYLAGTPSKPVSIKASVEHIESKDGTKVVSKHWVEEWVRDQEGRVWGVSARLGKSTRGNCRPLRPSGCMTRRPENAQSVRSRTENVRLTKSTLLPPSRSLPWGAARWIA